MQGGDEIEIHCLSLVKPETEIAYTPQGAILIFGQRLVDWVP